MKKIIAVLVVIVVVVGYYSVRRLVFDVDTDVSSIQSKLGHPSDGSDIPLTVDDNPGKIAASAGTAPISSAVAGYIYVSNLNTTTVSLCPLLANGSIAECTNAGKGFNAPSGLGLSQNRKILYVTNQGTNEIDACTINYNDGSLQNCAATGNGFNVPSAIVISPNSQFAYVTDENSNSVSRCQHDRINDTLSGCEQIMDGLFAPSDINWGNSGHIYIANSGNNTVLLCTASSVKGLVKCQVTGSDFSAPQSVTIDKTGKFAYVTNQTSNSISLCQVDQISGELSGCAATGTGFNAPSDFTFSQNGDMAFISKADSIMRCNVAIDGNLANCQQFNGNFNHSTGIRVIYK